jgi:hypothetical protein
MSISSADKPITRGGVTSSVGDIPVAVGPGPGDEALGHRPGAGVKTPPGQVNCSWELSAVPPPAMYQAQHAATWPRRI